MAEDKSNPPTLPTFNFGSGMALPAAGTAGGNNGFVFNFSSTLPNSDDDEEYVPGESGDEEDYDDEGLVEMTAEVVALQKLQDEYDSIELELAAEQRELLRKYEGRLKDVTDRRKGVIIGSTSVPPLEEEEEEGAPDAPKGIKGFWYKCLMQSQFDEIIDERDVPLLEKIVDITSHVLIAESEQPGFVVTFHFDENDYIENDTLSITCFIPGYPAGEEVDDVSSTPILWKEGKNLQKTVTLSGQEIDAPSFFKLFDPIDIPIDLKNADSLDEFDPSEIQNIMAGMQMREFVATSCFILREKIIPDAVNVYLGEADMGDEPEDGGGCCADPGCDDC